MNLLMLSLLAITADTRQLWDSPDASVSQNLGLTEIAIKYHRPAVKGREIWGKLVPYNEVWRTGANQATTIAFTHNVKVAGKDVPAGTYALFMLPTKEKWTFILSKQPEQWGAYSYKPDQDQLRFDVTPVAVAPQEWMRWDVELVSRTQAQVTLRWEKLEARFPVDADVDGIYQAYLTDELKKADAATDAKQKFQTYFFAAKYWVGRGDHLDEAKALLDKAEKAQPSFWVDEYRARLQFKQGKKADALANLEKAKKNAAGKVPDGYLAGLDELKKEWTKK